MLSVRVLPWPTRLAKPRSFLVTLLKQTTFCASCRSVDMFTHQSFLVFTDAPTSIAISHTGTPTQGTLQPIPAVVGPARTRTPSSRRFTPSTLLRDVTPRPSSPALTRRFPTSRSTLTHSVPSTRSTTALLPTLLLPSVATPRTPTSTAT